MEIIFVLQGLIFLGITALIVIVAMTNSKLKNVAADLEKTKETLSNLNQISKLSNVEQKLTDVEKEVRNVRKETNETVKDVMQTFSKTTAQTTTQIVDGMKNAIQDINKALIDHTKNFSNEFTSHIRDISESIGKLSQKLEAFERISSEIRTLQDIFKAPKQRGNFGEMLLENLIKDIFPKEMYEFQYSMGNERVDAVLKLNGKILPIDSKFPLDNYLKVIKEEKSIDALIRDVKRMIDDISRKYIKPSEYNTTNFALMYIPSESVWYSLFIENSSVFRYAVEKRVIPVSPNTLMCYFFVITEGLKAFEIEKRIEPLMNEIRSLVKEIEESVDELERLRKHMQNTLKRNEIVEKKLTAVKDRVNSLEGML